MNGFIHKKDIAPYLSFDLKCAPVSCIELTCMNYLNYQSILEQG